MIPAILSSWIIFALPFAVSSPAVLQDDGGYLSWELKRATSIGESMISDGRVGGWFDARVVHTEHSYNYKLRATWLTPEVIRASARVAQLRKYLTPEETRQLVADAEEVGDTVVLVEIDPREGSGIIPRDWLAVLQARGLKAGESEAVRGRKAPELRRTEALAGVKKKDYAYDRFWVVFPLVGTEGTPLFSEADLEAELIVRIRGKEGRVHWTIPNSIRQRSLAIANQK